MSFFLLLNTKEDILKNVGEFTVAIDFHSIFFPTMEVNGCHQLSGYPKYLLLYSTEKETHTSLEPQNFHFWVNYYCITPLLH